MNHKDHDGGNEIITREFQYEDCQGEKLKIRKWEGVIAIYQLQTYTHLYNIFVISDKFMKKVKLPFYILVSV